jgi:hypothetical protein
MLFRPCPEVLCERLAADVKFERWRCGYFSVDLDLFEKIDVSESMPSGSRSRRDLTADSSDKLLGSYHCSSPGWAQPQSRFLLLHEPTLEAAGSRRWAGGEEPGLRQLVVR